MRVRTPAELGALIRERRTALGLDQKTLAHNVGVSRQWIVDVEKGKPRAPIGLVLRTIEALGITLSPKIAEQQSRKSAKRRSSPVDLDAIVTAARKSHK
jgi:HTH-type transcriptional regulator / antitoxin HipB